MNQDAMVIGLWIMRDLRDRAEALLGGLVSNAEYGANIHAVTSLPLEDLEAIALAAYDRGFGDGERPWGYWPDPLRSVRPV